MFNSCVKDCLILLRMIWVRLMCVLALILWLGCGWIVDGFVDGSIATFTGVMKSLVDSNQVDLGSDIPLLFRDMSGLSTTYGSIKAASPAVSGIMATATDAQVFNWAPITGEVESSQLVVTGYQEDGTILELSNDPNITYTQSLSGLLEISDTGLVTATKTWSTPGGWVAIFAKYGSATGIAKIEVVEPTSYTLELSDPVLQVVQGYPAPGKIQTSQVKVFVTWTAGTKTMSEMDITNKVVVQTPSSLSFDSTTNLLSSVVNGDHTVTIEGATGSVLTSGTQSVDITTPATITDLTVILPCEIEALAVTPPKPSPGLGWVS